MTILNIVGVSSGGGGGFDPTASYSTSGNWVNTGTWTWTNAAIKLTGLGVAATSSLLYIDTVTGLITSGPVPGGGSGWNLTATNSGAGLKFGTNSADGINFQVNSTNFLTVSSALAVVISSASLSLQSTGAVTLATSAATSVGIGFTGTPVTILGSAMTITSNGGVAINANAGSITLTSGGILNTITMNGSVAQPTRLGIGNIHCSQIDLGNSATACPVTVLCNTWLNTASTSYTVQSPIIRFGTTATNVSITLGGSTTANFFGFGNFISIHSGSSSSFDSSVSVDIAATDATQLFLSNALCTTIFDATILQMPNMPSASGSGESYVVMDNTTKQLKAGSSTGGSYWSTAGNSGISGAAILGTLDNKTLFMQVNGTTIMEVDSPSFNITLGVSTGSFTLDCSGGGMNSTGNYSIDSDTILLLGANNAPQIHIGTSSRTTSIEIVSTGAGITFGTDLDIDTSGTLTIAGTGSIFDIGNASCDISVSANTWTLNTVSTLHLGSGGAMTIGTGLSIDIGGPAVTINTAASTNTTTIGNALTGNITVLASTNLQLSNIPSGTTAKVLYWDSVTKQVSQGAAGGGGGGLSWGTVAGTSQTMATNNGYFPLNAGTTTFSLPVTAAVGDTFAIAGSGSCQWIISENSGQFLQLGNEVTTTTSGTLSSADVNDGVQIVCMVANTKFYVIPFVGANFNLT